MSCRGFPYLRNKMKKVVGFGNPLLDTTVFVKDNWLLDKYNLKEDGQKEITKNDMQNIWMDISKYDKYQSAGGCAQNSLRVLQWLLKKQSKTSIFGSVGDDDDAVILKNLLEKDGVQTRYIIQKDLPTGKTISIVQRPHRSLVAFIGAAEKFPLSDLLANQDFSALVLEADFIYIEAFFLTKRTETATYVLDFCNKHNKITIFNISGEYVCNAHPDTVKYFAEHADIIFGNKQEFGALARLMKFSDEELTNYLTKNGNKKKQYGKILVITDGSKTGAYIYDGKVHHFDAPIIEENEVTDTTGAGDAFAGGFIAGLCTDKSVSECIQIGCYAALQIIKQIGFTLPDFEPGVFK